MRWWHIALPLGAVGAIMATTGRDDTGGPYPVSDFPKPLYVSQRGDPELEALLTELSDYLTAEGVDVSVASAAEITKMRKTTPTAYAIPDRDLWPTIAYTLKHGFMTLRWALGQPITIWNGYRPPDYNAAVGGAKGSRHQAFALDLSGQSPEATRELAELAAELYKHKGAELKLGLGIYGHPQPSRIHIDLGWKQRTWGDAKTFVSQV